jgi:hypothetical protein
VQDPPLDVEVEPVHLIVAADDFLAESQVAAGKGLQRLFQQELGLGAGPLHVALKGAQLLMKALPDLGHQPNPPVLWPSSWSPSPWLKTVASGSSWPAGPVAASAARDLVRAPNRAVWRILAPTRPRAGHQAGEQTGVQRDVAAWA